MILRDRLRWNGWGALGESYVLSRAREDHVVANLGRRLGRKLTRAAEPAALESIRIEPSKLTQETLAALRAACGEEGVRVGAFERIAHSTGRSLPDLLRLRSGELEATPDAIVTPADEGGVAGVLRVAAEAQLAVVPFGGGTSVVGGVEPRRAEGQAGVLALDTTRLDALVRLDPLNLTATFQAGIDGPLLERRLAEQGYTLGHFPQSFEHSTLGGWIATRSSGQQSSGVGSIDDLLVAVRVMTPRGVLRTLEVPRSAAGPDLREIVLGSEGVLGVIVEATLRVRPAPARAEARGLMFHSFEDGVAAVRELAQSEAPMSLFRLSDAAETELSALLRRDPDRRVDPTSWGLGALSRLGYGAGRALALYGAEARDAGTLRGRLSAVRRVARAHGAFPLGPSPGRSWRRDRFRAPYLRDWLLDWGVAVDTFETAVPWGRVPSAHAAVGAALVGATERHAGGGVAMAHLSHSYVDGACLYFTALYPVDSEEPLQQWRSIKRDATDAILAAGGTVSHHHGVGLDHRPWLAEEKGALGLEALRSLKESMDPQGLMNPGKLL